MDLLKQGRYSRFLKPIAYIIDLCIINLLALVFFKSADPLGLMLFISIGWVVIASSIKFYNVFRYTKPLSIVLLIVKQMLLYLLLVFSYMGYIRHPEIQNNEIFFYILYVIKLTLFFKFLVYFMLQKYRLNFGGNFRKVVIVGKNKKTKDLEHFFKNNPAYGYSHKKTFTVKPDDQTVLDQIVDYVSTQNIDQIYCSIAYLSDKQINKIINFADNNFKTLKFIPDTKAVFFKKMNYVYYDYIPVIKLRSYPLKEPLNFLIKRTFDIVFSIAVLLFILSWLTPIIALLIKLESKGPVFFKQRRNGYNYKEFYCYKFRSMAPNTQADLKQAKKNDHRVTKVGQFIRKTSLDELPQFVNVLLGDMSVVGPRPHMVSHSNHYARHIDKFNLRHNVKPGITGLAQIKGYRGAIEKQNDIINRVKYDLFYIENWSFLLDLNIIILTIINALRGEDNAY